MDTLWIRSRWGFESLQARQLSGTIPASKIINSRLARLMPVRPD
jgi:hypothetical protein